MFEWLKRILGIQKETSSPRSSGEERVCHVNKSIYDELDERKKNANNEKKSLTLSSADWYSIEIQKSNIQHTQNIFNPRASEELPTLKVLRIERLKKEALELNILKESINLLLQDVENYIVQDNANDAKQRLNYAYEKMARVKDVTLNQRYTQLRDSLIKLENKLERERLAKLAEEQKRKENEERKRKEAEERIRKEQERQVEEFRKKKQEEANRLAEEGRKREQAELAEKKRLETLSTKRKENWCDFKQVLDYNGIQYLYHFTDRQNIPSIKLHGGLFSWQYCDTHGITIPSPGGIGFGRDLDKKYGLEDYVRLSFCKEHPMKYIAMKDGRIQDPIVLLIDKEVIYLEKTLFSDMNATKTGHKTGGTLDDLNNIRFDIVKLPNHFDLEEPEKSFFQAEILVKTFIPKKYIVNLDKF